MHTETDVIIIGGGPTGAAAAITARQLGLSVALIESATFPRPRPGESVHPGISSLLKQLGVSSEVTKAAFFRFEGSWQMRDGGSNFEPFGNSAGEVWKGYHLWRERFDPILLDHARALGTSIYQPARALGLIKRQSSQPALLTTSGTFSARVIIDAGGGAHWLARQLDIDIQHYSRNLSATFGYKRCAETAPPEPEFILGSQGWKWSAHVTSGRRAWCTLEFSCDATPSGRTADVTWRLASVPAGPGYVLAGDAAAVLDPAAGKGVLRGIMSGIAAARVAAQPGGRSAKAYSRWLRGWFHSDRRELSRLYAAAGAPVARFLTSPQETDLWHLSTT